MFHLTPWLEGVCTLRKMRFIHIIFTLFCRGTLFDSKGASTFEGNMYIVFIILMVLVFIESKTSGGFNHYNLYFLRCLYTYVMVSKTMPGNFKMLEKEVGHCNLTEQVPS